MLSKSKLNSIEALVSRALVDMEINHEEFIAILTEKDKYERMKKNLRNVSEKLEENQENMRVDSVNSKKKTSDLLKSIEHFHHRKNLFMCVFIYKMYLISAEGDKNADVPILIIKKLVKFGQA